MRILYSGKIKFSLKRKIFSVLNCARKVLGQPKNLSVEITFVSEEDIHQLNRYNRGVDKVTDVLSFPMFEFVAGKSIDIDEIKEDIDEKTLMIGSIAICSNRAAAQAFEYGHSVTREVCFLALHGFLHLLGYDHIEKDDEELMQMVSELVLIRKHLKRGENG